MLNKNIWKIFSYQNIFWRPPEISSYVTYSGILIQLHFKCKAKEMFFAQKGIDYFLVMLLFYEFRTRRY